MSLICCVKMKHFPAQIVGFSTVSLYNTCSVYAWPWIWVKAVTSSHECMHHGAGVLIQTPPKNPLPRCGELLGLSQLLVTPSLSTHQWVRIRFSLPAGGKEMEIGRQGLQSMHLNNASMFKETASRTGSDRVQLCSVQSWSWSWTWSWTWSGHPCLFVFFSFGHFVKICPNVASGCHKKSKYSMLYLAFPRTMWSALISLCLHPFLPLYVLCSFLN